MKVLVTALLGVAAIGGAAPAYAWPKADEPNCIVAPYLSDCVGQPFGTPTSSSDSSCAMEPSDPVCAGGPYAPPAPPPDSGLPGALP